MKYRIAWRSKITGATGHGEPILTYERAKELCELLNRRHSGILEHWPEAVGEGEE